MLLAAFLTIVKARLHIMSNNKKIILKKKDLKKILKKRKLFNKFW